jgi:hypothetical protein
MQHYLYLTDNITLWLVATWFIQRGISPNSPEVATLEDFARARCNMQLGITDLMNDEWEQEPRNVRIMDTIASQIPLWTDLVHAPLAPNASAPATNITDNVMTFVQLQDAMRPAPAMEDVTSTVASAAPTVPPPVVQPSGITIITESLGPIPPRSPTPSSSG